MQKNALLEKLDTHLFLLYLSTICYKSNAMCITNTYTRKVLLQNFQNLTEGPGATDGSSKSNSWVLLIDWSNNPSYIWGTSPKCCVKECGCRYVLVWMCCCTLTFRILHFEVYDILKCKNFLIGFLDELGNFKQKINYISICKIYYILQKQTHKLIPSLSFFWKVTSYLNSFGKK